MDKNLLKTTAQRVNVYDETVIRKTEELLRIYQTKASIKSLDDQTRIVLCLDLASHALGTAFDKNTALSLSGLKKSSYQNTLNTLQKILGLDKTLTISDACVQLGCTSIKDDADFILGEYLKSNNKVKDLEHPQYVAAATYLACKLKKVSVDKQKFITLSRLRPSQWKELFNGFEKLDLKKESKVRQEQTEIVEDNQVIIEHKVQEVEDYGKWRQRILDEAYAQLKKEGIDVNMLDLDEEEIVISED